MLTRVSPTASRLRSETAERSSQVRCQHAKLKSIRSIAGTPAWRNGQVVVLDPALGGVREAAPGPDPLRRPSQLAPEQLVRVGLARDAQALVARRSRAAPSPGRRRSGRRPPASRAARRAGSPSGVPRGLSSPSKRMKWMRVARALDRARELGHHGRARRAVVGADEAVDVLGVVVGAHHDVAALAPAHGADHVAQAAGHLLVAPARQPLAQRPASSPRGLRAGRPRTQLDLRAQQPPGRGGVEAVDRRACSAWRLRRRRTGRCRSPRARPASGRAPPAPQARFREASPTRLWRVESSHGQARPQGPSQRHRRLLLAPGEGVLAHARRGARDVRRAAARARGVLRPHRVAARARSALSPEARDPAL